MIRRYMECFLFNFQIDNHRQDAWFSINDSINGSVHNKITTHVGPVIINKTTKILKNGIRNPALSHLNANILLVGGS